jgi:type VI secretion system protein ImpC
LLSIFAKGATMADLHDKLQRLSHVRTTISYQLEGGKRRELPFVVGVLADLSGQPALPLPPLPQRPLMAIDRDNFNKVMEQAAVQLTLTVPNRVADDGSLLKIELHFRQLNDFHPLQLIEQVHVLRELRNVSPSAAPGISEMLEINQKISAQLDAILHHPDFQRLEATWRGLHYLVQQTETCATLKIRVLNAGKRELLKDLEKVVKVNRTALFRKVAEEEFGHPAGEPYCLLVGGYEFSCHPDDINLLKMLSGIAAAAYAPFVAGAAPQLFNCERFTELTSTHELVKLVQGPAYASWKSFRESDESRYVALTVPHVLARPPYGARGEKIKALNYEESGDGRDGYLWMSAAWAWAMRVTEAWAKDGWPTRIHGAREGGKVDGLPVHEAPGDDGRMVSKFPAEIALSDKSAADLTHLGFVPLASGPGGEAFFASAHSCHKPKQFYDPAATAGAELGARLNYLLCASRFAHYVAVMLHGKLSPGTRLEEWQRRINDWLADYILDDLENAPTSTQARTPLLDAHVEIKPSRGKPSEPEVVLWFLPFYQFDPTPEVPVRLVVNVSPHST